MMTLELDGTTHVSVAGIMLAHEMGHVLGKCFGGSQAPIWGIFSGFHLGDLRPPFGASQASIWGISCFHFGHLMLPFGGSQASI